MGVKVFKYAIVDSIKPLVFDDNFIHLDMQRLGAVTSAGYFIRDGDKVVIVGESISLTIKNGEHDKEILERFYSDNLKGGG